MKKNAKRWLAMLLCLTMTLSLLPAMALPAFAAGTEQQPGMTDDPVSQGEPGQEPGEEAGSGDDASAPGNDGAQDGDAAEPEDGESVSDADAAEGGGDPDADADGQEDEEPAPEDNDIADTFGLERGIITPDGAVEDTWKLDENTKKDENTVCEVTEGKLHLKTTSSHGNNGGDNVEKPPAIFINETMNAALAASEEEEKFVSFDIEPVADSVTSGSTVNPLFGIALNYRTSANSSNSSNRDVEGYFINYDSMSKWFYQAYYGTNEPYGSLSSTEFVAQKYHIEVKWTKDAVTSFTINNGSNLITDDVGGKMADVVSALGELDSVGFKVGYGVSPAVTTGDFYISNLHYTGQATIETYAVSGKVTDENDAALAGVKVDAGNGTTATTTTDADGNYSLELPDGKYTLTFSKDGYTNATQEVTVSGGAAPGKNVTLAVAHTVEIPVDGVDNEDWTQIAATKVSGSVDPEVTDGKLVLTSGVTNGHKLGATPLPALFTSAKLNTELAASKDTTKTLSFTLTPETKHSAAGELPDLLTFGVVIDSNESNQGFMISYSYKEGWLMQNYGGSGYKVVDLVAPTAGKPIDFKISWDRTKVTLMIDGQEVNHGVGVNTLPKTDKIAFFTGGAHYATPNGSLQDDQQTVVRISKLHYSGQEKVTAYKVAGTVKDNSDGPLEGATVSADNGRFTATTDATGAYSLNLPEGTYTLKAEKDGYSTEEKSSFAVASNSDPAVLEATNFELTLLPTISGTVKGEDGRPLRASVSSDKRPKGSAVVCNEKGEFTIIGALAGEHTLTAELEGYETTTKKVTVNDANVTGVEIVLPEREIPSYELQTSDMTVKVAQKFPQAIQYTMKNIKNSDGSPKKMYGQTAELDTIKINGTAIVPTVTSSFDENNPTKVTYTMVIDESNNNSTDVTATITAEIRVGLGAELNNPNSDAAGRTLGFYITNVEYAGADAAAKAANRLAHPVDTIEIPNHSLVSVRSTETNPNVSGAKLAANTINSGDSHYAGDTRNLQSAIEGYAENFFAAFVYNSDLSAGLASNSAYGTGSAGSGTYPVRVQFEAKDGNTTVSIGLGSTLWYYDHDITRDEAGSDKKLTNEQLSRAQRIIAPLETPFAKVVITGDMNANGEVDWQDGAIAYRETVMHIPAGGEGVADAVNLRISMNFGSMATNPFLIALDNVKRVAAHTDGLGQFVLLKGYAGEGHDSNHPQYDNIGVRMGGVEDLKTLIREGGALGATFGIHTNASEFYAEAIDEENQVRRNTDGSIHYGWNWLDQGIAINGVYDYASGLQKQRWDALYKIVDKELVGDHPFVVYVDVWGNYTSGTENDFMTRALSQNIVSHDGWRIAHEWSYGNPYESTFQHWVTDYTYGAYSDKGKLNSNVLRFLLNEYKDSFPPDFATFGGAANAPLLGGPAMQGFEGWQGDGEYNLSIYNTYNQMIYTKFLQHYNITEWKNAANPTEMWWWANANSSSKTAGKTVENDDGTITLQNQNSRGGWDDYGGTVLWTPESQITLESDDGTQTVVVTRGLDTTPDDHYDYEDGADSEVVYRSRVITLNGTEILRGAPASAGEDTRFPASKATLQYLIPWYWDANGDRVTSAQEKLYHWNAQGGESTWELPDGWKNLSSVTYYELSDQGRGPAMTLNVINRSITFPASTKANTGYVVVQGASNKGPQITYGEGLHLEDPSFNTDIANGPWTLGGNGSAIRTTNSDGISVLKLIGAVSVSQKLSGLTAGTKYVTYAGVDNRSSAKAIMTITDSTGKVVATNYTQRSIARNYISSYYLHNGHGVEAGGSYFQNMFLYFTPETGEEYTLTLSREAGSGSIYFDDVRTVEYGLKHYGETNRATPDSPVEYVKDEDGNATGEISRLYQDFENVPQGIWPFVVGPVEGVADNRTHLSELNAKTGDNGVSFTQAGWDVKKMDDVIDGRWSIKTNGLTKRNNLVYQTIPQNFRFEPDKIYTVSFDYEMGSAGAYAAVVGDGAYTGVGALTVYDLEQTLKIAVPTTPNVTGKVNKADVGHIEFTVVGSQSGQTWIGIYSKNAENTQGVSGSAADFGGYKDFVLDNLTIELADAEKNELALLLRQADSMVEEVYIETTAGDWTAFVTARTEGHTVFDKDGATSEEITAAVNKLTAAIAKLTKASISISGTVKNANDTPVEGVVLTLEDADYRPVGMTLTTGADGTYTFEGSDSVELLPGTYHIKAQGTGYLVTTTNAVVITKTAGEKIQDISLVAEAPGAYVNDFNNGDISMIGALTNTDDIPTWEIVEFDGSKALKVTFNSTANETRGINNAVDKSVKIKNGTVSFDITGLTNTTRLGITLRAQDADTRIFVGQEDSEEEWFWEWWNGGNSSYEAPTVKDIGVYPGETRRVRVELNEQNVQVFIDGVQIYNSTMTGAPSEAGWVGINMRNNAGTSYILDNLRIVSTDTVAGKQNVSGTVTARSGVAVSGAAIELFDGDTRVTGTTTNALGAYQLTGVEPGDYTMKVSAPFFASQEKDITVEAQDVTGENFTLIPDRTTLNELISEVEALAEADYTPESWASLQMALTAAKAMNDESTAAALQTAYRDLTNAKAALERAAAGDYTALRTLYNEKSGTVNEGYTNETWTAFQTALNKAAEILARDATQTEIDAAKDALAAAYANLTKASFEVTFNSNGGNNVASQNVVAGECAVKPADPTRSGYAFAGWYLNSDGSGTAYDFATVVTGNITLYAKWTAVGKAALTEALAAANAAKVDVLTMPNGTTEAEVTKGAKFVTKDVMDALDAAIADAKDVEDDADATQAAIDAAVETLNAAVATFNRAIKTGTNENVPLPVDKSELAAAIATANAAKESVETKPNDTTEADVEDGTKFVTQDVMDALKAAIATAEDVKNNDDATQADVDEAVDALNAAVATFNSAVKTGTYTQPSIPSGGGSSSGSSTTTTVEKNPDGSTTTTVTDKKTGTVTETTEKPDGTKEIVETKKDGTVTETTEKTDGSKEVVETKKDGTVTETKTDAEGAKTEKVTDSDKNVAITVTDKDGEVLAKVELPAEIPAPETRFEDVPEGHWADEAIHNMAALEVVNGVGDNHFDMDSSMTRGALATVLSRLSNGQKGLEVSFTDVDADKWYADGIAWAAKTGVVTGYSESNFGPEDVITREQLAVMLCRYARLLGMDTTTDSTGLDKFNDGSSTHDWAADSIAWCVNNGILNGMGNGNLAPTATATRAQVAVMLQRFMDLMK